MDDLGFLTSGNSIQEVATTLEITGETVIRWGLANAVTYNIAKTEAILFSPTRSKKVNKETAEIRLTIGKEEIKFNNQATRWLGIWLDSGLIFNTHVKERVKQARAAEARIKGLTRTYGLPSGLVRKIQIAAVQAIALFGAEIWWRGQKMYQDEIQKLLNRQGRAITGMYRSAPVGPLMSESGLIPAQILLDYRQRKYAYRLLTLPDGNLTKSVLPITLRSGDGNAQPGEQPENDGIWAQQQKARNYGQHLAQQVSIGFCIDPAYEVEPVVYQKLTEFPGKIIIQDGKTAILEAKKDLSTLALWTDGSKVESGGAGAAVAWKNPSSHKWEVCKIPLGKNKEILDAELWDVSQALKIALNGIALKKTSQITVYSDAQRAIKQLQSTSNKEGQVLKAQICKLVRQLRTKGGEVIVRWIPSHSGLEGNERADKAATEAAANGRTQAARWSSLTYVRQTIVNAKNSEICSWHWSRNEE